MRKLEPTTQFRRDYKRVSKGPLRDVLAKELPATLNLLAQDAPLPERLRDHALTGEWRDHRDCHIRPDLLLIYSKPDDAVLQLVRLGSYSALGL